MSKRKISLTIASDVLATADADASALQQNRSEFVEEAVRQYHLRLQLRGYVDRAVPELGIDAYAEHVYGANRASGL